MVDPSLAPAYVLAPILGVILGIIVLPTLAFVIRTVSAEFGSRMSWPWAILVAVVGLELLAWILFALQADIPRALGWSFLWAGIWWVVLTFLVWPVAAALGRKWSWKLVVPSGLSPLVVLLILVLYYSIDGGSAARSFDGPTLPATRWELVSIRQGEAVNQAGSDIRGVIEFHEYWPYFMAYSAYPEIGCPRGISGWYDTTGGSLRLNPDSALGIGSGCEPPKQFEWLLRSVRSYSVNGDTLTAALGGGDRIATFRLVSTTSSEQQRSIAIAFVWLFAITAIILVAAGFLWDIVPPS